MPDPHQRPDSLNGVTVSMQVAELHAIKAVGEPQRSAIQGIAGVLRAKYGDRTTVGAIDFQSMRGDSGIQAALALVDGVRGEEVLRQFQLCILVQAQMQQLVAGKSGEELQEAAVKAVQGCRGAFRANAEQVLGRLLRGENS